MLDAMVASLNARSENGSYLFSGTQTDARTVTLNEQGEYVYGGNDGVRETTVANGVAITENTNVVQAFSGSGSDLETLNKLKALSEKMQDPTLSYADYQGELEAMIDMAQNTSDSLSGLFTDLGGRQNRLTLLDDAHTNVSLSNDLVVRDLSETDWATASVNLTLYTQSVQITNKAYSMVSQLNLFSLL